LPQVKSFCVSWLLCDGDLEEVAEGIVLVDGDGEGTIIGELVAPCVGGGGDGSEGGGDVLCSPATAGTVQLNGEGVAVGDSGDLEVVVAALGSSVVVDRFHEEDTGGGGSVIDAVDGGIPAGGVVHASVTVLCLVEEDNDIDGTGNTVVAGECVGTSDESTIAGEYVGEAGAADGAGLVDEVIAGDLHTAGVAGADTVPFGTDGSD